MKIQQLYSYTRRAIDDYEMIQDGDKIAIGISGGKDSLTLLYALSGLRRFYPKKFNLIAITVDLGYDTFDLSEIEKLCHELDVPYYTIHTEIAKIIFEERKEDSPCSLCAKMRKGALNEKAKELGCNKVAYAHHMDDVIETMFLSLIFEGQFYCFSPKTFLDKTKLTVIRPLIYVPEANVIGFMNKFHLPIVKNPCPVDGFTKREYAKNLTRQIHKDYPGAKTRIFHAICEGNIPGWPKKQITEKIDTRSEHFIKNVEEYDDSLNIEQEGVTSHE